MLATSERVRPWSARWRFWSVGRVTSKPSSPSAMEMSGSTASASWPLGPFTTTWFLSETEIVTPAGVGIGSFPIRDMGVALSAGA